MFTLEDLDIQAGLAELLAANPDLLSLSGHPTPEADVRLHPEDYFVVGAWSSTDDKADRPFSVTVRVPRAKVARIRSWVCRGN